MPLSFLMLRELYIRNSRGVKYFSHFNIHKTSKMVTETKHLKKGDPEPNFPDDGKLHLFSMRFCAYAQRTLIILEAKNIPYHTYNINLFDKPEWLTKYSPLGKVPSLGLPNEKGKPFIHESLVIADYLDEKYPEKKLYPKDPLAKAVDKLLIERFGNVSSGLYKVLFETNDSEGQSQISNGLVEFEKELDKRGTTFFGGDEPGMLDYMIWPWCERLAALKYIDGDKYELDQSKFPKLVEWNSKMIADPAVSVHYLNGEFHKKFADGFKTKQSDFDMLLK